jgi:hypothetical protein
MLGVKFDNRESVHDPKKVVLTPNIGLEGFDERFWELHGFSRAAQSYS